jgi:hypothetical protein
MSALFRSMDLFLSSAIVVSPPCGKGTFPAERHYRAALALLVFAGSLRPKLVPKLALYLRMLPIGSIHLPGAADTRCLGSAGKTSVNLQ